ncbi:MAG TPA: preprotein translocase subunit SecA [Ignavibacteriales bacterium]|nr:preprotein translocase subunit SecA [Ignavibacteriales bacterium]
MLEFLKKFFPDKHQKALSEIYPIVDEINKIYETLNDLSDDELRAKVQGLKEKIQNGTQNLREEIHNLEEQLKIETDEEKVLDITNVLKAKEKELDELYEDILWEILPEAYAIVKDTCRRLVGKSWDVVGHTITWNMVPYDVQLIGGIVLHQGKIAEMATGEGKTLVATLPLFLNALTGRGVHLVTVNDYLARRDSEWMGEVFKFHGLTVGCIQSQMSNSERRKQYQCDITYGTNNEFGFDYLRDNMAITIEETVQRGHVYAIVDEVDSVLIDEARTPLIISGPVDSDDSQFYELKPKVESLYKKQMQLVSSIVAEAEQLLQSEKKEEQFRGGVLLLRAHRGLPRHKKLLKLLSEPAYKRLMQETEMEYLREQAARMHEIDDELYFVIDEKNNIIDLTEKGREELAKGTVEGKDYFVLPDIGTEVSVIENDHSLTVDQKIQKKEELYKTYATKSERLHILQQLFKAYTLFERDVQYVVTEDKKIAIVDEFTGRILPGRRYSDGLHQAIEAKENVHVEQDTQTLATITLQNYFRMYKKLAGMTGTAETEENEFYDIYKLEVVVIPTNKPCIREDLDDAIYRTKREKYNAVIKQIEELRKIGRPVLVGTVSVEASETLSRMLKRVGVPHNVLNAKQHQREAEIVAFAGQPGAVTIATNMAGRGTDIKLGAGVAEKGGLYILGTERHESRRIDRQLRGRAGRQGDPGTSKFFISLEDDLMRLFGSDRITRIMERMGFEEGEVIEHPMITRSVTKAQKKVEENNFAIRKRLLEYDNVMNQQREVIYSRRRNAILGNRLKSQILEYLETYCEEVVDLFYETADVEGLKEKVLQDLLVGVEVVPEDFANKDKNILVEKIFKAAKEFYEAKELRLGTNLMANLERYATLSIIDDKWREHLKNMDDLKEGINLRAYGQKDPLLEYKKEAYELFMDLIADIRNQTLSFVFKAFPHVPEEVQVQQKKKPKNMVQIKEEAAAYSGESQQPVKREPIRVEEKVGRNDPCPCGSGKKFKNCHGK